MHRGRRAADRAADRDGLPRRARGLARRRARPARGRAGASSRALSIGLLGNAAEVLPELVRRGARRRRGDRPDERARPAQRLRARRPHGRAGGRAARGPTRTTTCARVGESVLGARRRDPLARARGRRGVRLRQRAARRGRRTTATRTRSPTRASCPPTSGRCSARARARSAGSRCPATPRTSHATDRAILELFGEQDHIRRWIELAAERVRVPGAAGADLLARLRRAPPGRAALQRDGRLRAR